MNEKIKIGDFVNVEFIYRFVKDGRKMKNWFDIYATVTGIDKYVVEFTDNHGQEYLVQKRDIKKYIR